MHDEHTEVNQIENVKAKGVEIICKEIHGVQKREIKQLQKVTYMYTQHDSNLERYSYSFSLSTLMG